MAQPLFFTERRDKDNTMMLSSRESSSFLASLGWGPEVKPCGSFCACTA
jgi:hypothetical protein